MTLPRSFIHIVYLSRNEFFLVSMRFVEIKYFANGCQCKSNRDSLLITARAVVERAIGLSHELFLVK